MDVKQRDDKKRRDIIGIRHELDEMKRDYEGEQIVSHELRKHNIELKDRLDRID